MEGLQSSWKALAYAYTHTHTHTQEVSCGVNCDMYPCIKQETHAETHTVTVHITHTERVGIYFSLSGERNTWQKLFLRYLSLTQGMIVSYYSGQSPDFWAATSSFSFFSFPPSPYFPFQLWVLLGPSKEVGAWEAEGGERWIQREGKGEAERERERNRESKRRSPVTASSQPTGLGPVGSGKRSHHLQTIIQCPHLDLLSAPVTPCRQCDKLK